MTYLLDRLLDALMLPSLLVMVACVVVAGVGCVAIIRELWREWWES